MGEVDDVAPRIGDLDGPAGGGLKWRAQGVDGALGERGGDPARVPDLESEPHAASPRLRGNAGERAWSLAADGEEGDAGGAGWVVAEFEGDSESVAVAGDGGVESAHLNVDVVDYLAIFDESLAFPEAGLPL